ncbi:MAG: prepilin peptidase [Actinobacteria bacterium]|nr:prepilin peptidase [Actinomycetota bacterium]
MNEVIYYILFLVAGLITGSFLEVVIYRIPRKISLIRPSSFCPECGKKIAFYDNIPLISYLALRGRCRNCKKRIHLKTLLVEIITGLLFMACYAFFGISLYTLNGIILCSLLVAISFIDLEFGIIPNVIVIPFSIAGLALNIFLNLPKWWLPPAFAAGAFIFMLIIHLVYPAGMGMGDVKLSFMVGAFLIKSVVVGLFAGFLVGSVAGLILIIKNRKLRQAIPFGPFISIGSIIALFWGNNILKWYTGFF